MWGDISTIVVIISQYIYMCGCVCVCVCVCVYVTFYHVYTLNLLMFYVNLLLLLSHSELSDSATPWTSACQASLFFTISQSLLKFASIDLVIPSNHLILWHPCLLLPSIFSSIKAFSKESALCTNWPKYWSFSCSISPSSEYSGLISLMIDGFDLLAAQGTLQSLLQHWSSKSSILKHSAFFMVQLSHLYMTNGKTIALTKWTLVQSSVSAF